jgi:hypothetical protein
MSDDASPTPVSLSALLEALRARHAAAARPEGPLKLAKVSDEPFAALLADLKARLNAYSRSGWAVEVNGHPHARALPHGAWVQAADGSLTVTLTLVPTR